MPKRAFIFISLGIVILAGLFFWFQPPGQRLQGASPGRGQAGPVIYRFVVRGGDRQSGPAVIHVQRGGRVALRVTTDRVDELHIHGYDQHAELAAGQTTRITLRAEHAGRFPVELHAADTLLTTLEVRPR